MQTFLPYADFNKTASVLDNKRLNKQRVETWQIYNILKTGEFSVCPLCKGRCDIDKKIKEITSGKLFISDIHCCPKCNCKGKIKTAWYNHPAVQMWKWNEAILLEYGIVICEEWIRRGYKDSLLTKFKSEYKKYYEMRLKIQSPFSLPKWLGNEKFHSAMRANLLRKDPKWYGQFGWKEKPQKGYWWPTKEIRYTQ